MKLEELNLNSVSIFEIFDSSIKIEWEHTSTGEDGIFKINDKEFVLHINNYNSINLKSGNFTGDIVDISFDRIKDGKSTIEITNDGDSIKIFAAVYNGIIDKFKESKTTDKFPNSLIFSAKHGIGYDSRVKLYKMIQRYISKFSYKIVKPIETHRGTVFILTRSNLSGNDFNELIDIIKSI